MAIIADLGGGGVAPMPALTLEEFAIGGGVKA